MKLHRPLLVLAALALLVVASCSDDAGTAPVEEDTTSAETAADPEPVAYAEVIPPFDVVAGSDTQASVPWAISWESEGSLPSTEAVILDLAETDAATHEATITVSLANFSSLFGLAFRVTYDPACMVVDEVTVDEELMTDSSARGVVKAAVKEPGLVLVGAGRIELVSSWHQSSLETIAISGPAPLVTLEATMLKEGSCALGFATYQRVVRDGAYQPIETVWLGGAVVVEGEVQ